MKLEFKKLREDAIIPEYKSVGAAGFDLNVVLDENSVVLEPGEQEVLKTGLAVAVPDGFQMEIRPRSGLAAKQGVTITNSPGTLDCDYRGEICVILLNLGKETVTINQHDRIAQGVIMPAPQFEITEVNELSETERGSGGFGSTGK
jgi:dUTP pyrophosphatase